MDIVVPSLKYCNFKNELFQVHTHYSKELTAEEDQNQLQILLKKKENKIFLFQSISKITKHFDKVERSPVANDEIYLLFEKRPIIQDKNITFLRNNKKLKLDQNRYHFAVGILTEEMKKQIQSSSESSTDATEDSDATEGSDTNTESDKNNESDKKEKEKTKNDESEESDDSSTQIEEIKKNDNGEDNVKEEKEEIDNTEESKEEEGEKEIDNNKETSTIDLIQTPRKKKGGFVDRVLNFAKYISPWKRGEDNLPKTEQKKKEELEQDLERKRAFQENEEESENEEVIVNYDNDQDENENKKKEMIEQKKNEKKY